ncbi:hypothetical protein CH274_16855 [Rhodococcus sp. 06-418-5]|uniref:hypothetical protein n=1 Tax=Rhodococcus sp. 06-418-5 TaxID=2022507 RepID=UPI000B9A1A37|nr:hypothetical protein [Rhodococcus sp. 06-418-5]OZC79102.1 hypothetical protein CH274_16855 [Rhodococcus sp. 06-418-5]
MLINRCASALAVISAVLHLEMGVGGASGMLVTAMAVVCVVCAADLWRSTNNRAWVVMAASSAVMLLAHASSPSGHHQPVVTDAVSGASAASILAAVELTLAAVVVFVRTRGIPPELLHHRLQEPR